MEREREPIKIKTNHLIFFSIMYVSMFIIQKDNNLILFQVYVLNMYVAISTKNDRIPVDFSIACWIAH